MSFQVVVLATGQKAGSNLNVIKLPLSRGMPVKIVGMKKGNTNNKNKKKKGVDKNASTAKPGGKVKDASLRQDLKNYIMRFRERQKNRAL